MTERRVLIRLDLEDHVQNRPLEVKKQLDSLNKAAAKAVLNVQVNGANHIQNLIRSIEQAKATAAKPTYYQGSATPSAGALSSVSLDVRKIEAAHKKQQAAMLAQMATLITPEGGQMSGGMRGKVFSPGQAPPKQPKNRGEPLPGSGLMDINPLVGNSVGKAVPQLSQFQGVLGNTGIAALSLSRSVKAVDLGSLKNISSGAVDSFRTMNSTMKGLGFGAVTSGATAFKYAIGRFVSGEGSNFQGWLKNATSGLAEHKLALLGAAGALAAVATQAAMTSKTSANRINSTLNTHMMGIKLTDKEGAKSWIEGAQKDDWSAGRDSRLGVFQTVLSKNKGIGQKQAQKRTEDIEKFFFANQEMMADNQIGSAKELASAISAPELSGDDARKFDDIFGLGFSKLLPQARLARLSTDAPNDEELKEAEEDRPDVIMQKRLSSATASMGDAVLPALNAVLGGFLKISDAIGKIPGLGPMLGWGAVLGGAAAGGLALVAVVGSMIPGIQAMIGLTQSDTAVKVKNTAVTWARTAATWASSAAMGAYTAVQTIATGGAYALAAGMWAALAPVLPFVAAGALLAVVLGAVANKAGLLGPLLKGFKSIDLGKVWGDLSKGDFSKAWKGLTKGFKLPSLAEMWGNVTSGIDLKKLLSGGALRLALDVGTSMAMPMLKPALMLVDFIRKLWANSETLNKLFRTASWIWQRMSEFLNWLWAGIKSLQSWLATAIPGSEKEEARKQRDKQAEREGLRWNGTEWITKEGFRGTPSSKLSDMQTEYNNLPDFAGGVAKAVADGMKGVAMTIPGMSELVDALEKLTTTLDAPKNAVSGVVSPITGKLNNLGGSDQYTDSSGAEWHYKNGNLWTQNPADSTTTDVDPSTAPDEVKKRFKFAGGATFQTGGLFQGEVDPSEEIIPQAITRRGAGPMSQMLERFQKAASGGQSFSSGGQQVSISAPINIYIDKIEKEADSDKVLEQLTEKLPFTLRNALDNLGNRNIGYQRG